MNGFEAAKFMAKTLVVVMLAL